MQLNHIHAFYMIFHKSFDTDRKVKTFFVIASIHIIITDNKNVP